MIHSVNQRACGLLIPTALIEKMFNFSMLCLSLSVGYYIKRHRKDASFPGWIVQSVINQITI